MEAARQALIRNITGARARFGVVTLPLFRKLANMRLHHVERDIIEVNAVIETQYELISRSAFRGLQR